MKFFGKKHIRKPASLKRIAAEFLAIVLLHTVMAEVLVRVHLVEHMLSPGRDSYYAICVAAFFMMIRGIVIVLGSGWLLARLWLYATRSSAIRERTSDTA